MPNWCDNELEIRGKAKDLIEVANAVKGENGEFDFNQILPYPEKFTKLDAIATQYMKDNPDDWAGRPKDGYNQGGYEWCANNWGTKWNTSCNDNNTEDAVERLSKLDPETVAILSYTFDTAWAPPTPVMLKLSEQFPKVTVMLSYWEAGCAFKGDYEATAGVVGLDITSDYIGVEDESGEYNDEDGEPMRGG